MKLLLNVKNNKVYKLSKDSGEDIKKMYDEFIEESYEDIYSAVVNFIIYIIL